MKIFFANLLKAAALSLSFIAAAANAQTNNWTNPGDGSWGNAVNWSAGVPTNGEDILITNLPGKTVTVDSTAPINSLTVDSVTVGAAVVTGNPTNILTLDGSLTSPLHIINNFVLQSGSAVIVNTTNGIQVDGDGGINAGILVGVTSPPGSVQNSSTFTINSGLVETHFPLYLGASTNSVGTLNLNGGTLSIPFASLDAGDYLFSTGIVSVAGGTLDLSGSGMILGNGHRGFFTMSSGLAKISGISIGGGSGSSGTLTLSGGVMIVPKWITIGNNVGADACFVTVGTNSSLYVTNGTQTAYVDVAANSSLTLNGGLLQLDNLILTNGGSFTNLAGTLIFTQPFQVDNGSSVTVSGSGGVITTPYNFTLGTTIGSTGSVFVANGGTLNITNTGTTLGIGNDGSTTNGTGTGIVTLSNATINATAINLGSTAGGIGTFMLQSNSILNVASNFTVVSSSLTQTSTVTMTGGTINASNSTIAIGPSGTGLMNVNGGSVIARLIQLGGSGSSGELQIGGGLVRAAAFSLNFILVDGGDLDGSGGSVTIGDGHDAAMELDSGTSQAGSMFVGYSPGFTGTYTQTGGTMNVFTNLVVGDCIGGALGIATLNGGIMYVTNTTHTAVLDVRNGTFTLNAGATLVVDTLVVTNSCGQFLKRGGVLITNNAPILGPNLDADGDGQSNAAELAAGTDPFDPTSLFMMTGASVSNSDVRVYWTTVGGHNYFVQTNGDLSHGTFSDLSAPIAVLGTGAGTTNYLHQNGATNRASFYRVRLGP